MEHSRLRAAIRLCSNFPPPRVLTLGGDMLYQPESALPGFHHSRTSALAPVIAWLDAVFACSLSELAVARAPETGAGWISDVAHILRSIARDGDISRVEEARRFQLLRNASGWRTSPIGRIAPNLDHRYARAVGILQNDYAAPRPKPPTPPGAKISSSRLPTL